MSIAARLSPDAAGTLRASLLARGFLILLGFDIWVLMIRHAGRYGAGGFNVAHFPFLDGLMPSPELYLGVLALAGLIAVTMAYTGLNRALAALLFLLYTFAWAMSLIDTFQHHYFISLVLFCMIFFPRGNDVSAGEDTGGAGKSVIAGDGWGFGLLCLTVAIVYFFTAVAKMDPIWLSGYTLSRIAANSPVGALVEWGRALGLSGLQVWSAVSVLTTILELLLSVCYLAALGGGREEGGPSARTGSLRAAGLTLAVVLHVGGELMNLRIGWFSYYMLWLALCFFLPLRAIGLVNEARFFGAVRNRTAGVLPKLPVVVSSFVVAGLLLVLIGATMDLPGIVLSCAAAVLLFAVVLFRHLWRRDLRAALRLSIGAGAAATLMWIAITAGGVRWSYYRFVAGDLRLRRDLQGALEAYEHAERYAPRGQSRAAEIEEIKRIIGG